jgi:hypothetical protein
VTALLDFTLYYLFTHLRPLDLYLDSYRTIVYAYGSPYIVTWASSEVVGGERLSALIRTLRQPLGKIQENEYHSEKHTVKKSKTVLSACKRGLLKT